MASGSLCGHMGRQRWGLWASEWSQWSCLHLQKCPPMIALFLPTLWHWPCSVFLGPGSICFQSFTLPGSLCISDRQVLVSVSINLVFYMGTLDCNTLPPTCGYRICFLRTTNKRSSISHETNPTFIFPHTLPFIALQGHRQYDSCGIHFMEQIMVHVPQELTS